MLNRFLASCFSPSLPLPIQQTAVPASGPSLSNITCSEEDVFHLLSTSKAASEPDGISSAILHDTADSFPPALTFIQLFPIPMSSTGGLDTPVSKCSDPSLANILISLLSLVSIVLEHLIHSKLLNYILSNNLLSDSDLVLLHRRFSC